MYQLFDSCKNLLFAYWGQIYENALSSFELDSLPD